MNKKNIVLFVADQMRSDSLAHMGNAASITPNLDRLAKEGISFENAYCQNPVCVPSRCSFLSGLYPHTTGHRTMHFLQREDEENILRRMKQNGYEVIWIGRNDVLPAGIPKTEYCDEFYNGMDQLNRVNPEGLGESSFFKKSGDYMKDITRPEFMNDISPYSFYLGKQDSEFAKQGFDYNCIQSALDYIDRREKDGSEKPFLLYISLIYPHPPYVCSDPWYSMIDRTKLPERRLDVEKLQDKPGMLYRIREKQELNNWTEQQYDELRATYLAMVSQFDEHYGILSDKLKASGLYDDTSIFVFSDHGDYTGDYGIVEKVQNCFEDPISNIPLIVKPSGSYNVEARITPALVELLDLPATICEIAGIDLGYTQFGKSLVHTFSGDDEHKDAVFCEGGRLHGEVQAMEGGHGPKSQYWPRLSTQCEEGPQHTKACMIRMGNLKYTYRLYEKDELYDLDKDPMELRNAIDDPAYSERLTEMKGRLLQYYMQTADYVPVKRDAR